MWVLEEVRTISNELGETAEEVVVAYRMYSLAAAQKLKQDKLDNRGTFTSHTVFRIVKTPDYDRI